MQITRQADYALRAMLYLARNDKFDKNSKKASTSQIAKDQEIPASFLAKIISQLSIAGLITTTRGASGGVSLARDKKDITLLDVVEAIDGPITLNECTQNPNICTFGKTCPLHSVWCEAQVELVNKLRSTTFEKLIAMEKSKA
jgi:Rrf2 family protein